MSPIFSESSLSIGPPWMRSTPANFLCSANFVVSAQQRFKLCNVNFQGVKTTFLTIPTFLFPALTEGYVGSLHENRHGSSVQIRRRKASGDPYWAYSGELDSSEQ